MHMHMHILGARVCTLCARALCSRARTLSAAPAAMRGGCACLPALCTVHAPCVYSARALFECTLALHMCTRHLHPCTELLKNVVFTDALT